MADTGTARNDAAPGDRGEPIPGPAPPEHPDNQRHPLADQVRRDAPALGLVLLGLAPDGPNSIALLGPDPETFWDHLTSAPEWDGAPDPVDRWSRRVIGGWADRLAVEARFPFGTPVQPFLQWALASGRCRSAPVGMLVHDTLGLMVSFRGALVLPEPAPVWAGCDPCAGCAAPCLSACPADALGQDGYDIPRCRTWLAGEGTDCMARGCAVRRICPRSPRRPDAQSAHHMRAFRCD